MVNTGITHRDKKGIQTKIQELQTLYSKARNFQGKTGSGLLDDAIANGTSTLPGGGPPFYTQTNILIGYICSHFLLLNSPAALIKI
ncbi:uncharacterized protein VP01_603g11 [Puccinia sorghi]|uniref:Uncharacterized protein n=1 Tax=Puccinia sorghi TaxID=27349 RepID=A0A0L6UJF5_9BASI|nr:uncharacterized protein VP01_603g11 [Puccinia sorghi]